MEYNIYCDESCHLQNDNKNIMAIGCIWCPSEKTYEIHTRLREIKIRNKIPAYSECKWTKISPCNVQMYEDIVNYFFDNDDISFRIILIDKTILNHSSFSQTHDTWYYKMMFQLISIIPEPDNTYNVYLDYKDTQGNEKCKKLHNVLCNSEYDFKQEMIKKVQCVQSSDVGLIQLCDILIGAIRYYRSGCNTSPAKIRIVNLIKKRSRSNLLANSYPSERKFNVFHWKGDHQ